MGTPVINYPETLWHVMKAEWHGCGGNSSDRCVHEKMEAMAASMKAVAEAAHCPLCVDKMLHNPEDTREKVYIFLDMDDVMIFRRGALGNQITATINKLFKKVPRKPSELTDYHWAMGKPHHLDRTSLENLGILIDRIKAENMRPAIILSTAWRNDATLDQLREAFSKTHFGEYICGKTAPEKREQRYTPESTYWGHAFAVKALRDFQLQLKNRADVIEYWLRDHGLDPEKTRFVAIDDDHDELENLGRFKHKFVKIQNAFDVERVEEAAAALLNHCPLCTTNLAKKHLSGKELVPIFLEIDGVLCPGDKPQRRIKKTLQDNPPWYQEKKPWLYWKERHEKETSAIEKKSGQFDAEALVHLYSLADAVSAADKIPLFILSFSWSTGGTLDSLQRLLESRDLLIHGKTAPERWEMEFSPECRIQTDIYGTPCREKYDLLSHAKKVHELALETPADVVTYWLKDHDLDKSPFIVIGNSDPHYASLRTFGERFIPVDKLFIERDVAKALTQICPKGAGVKSAESQ